MKKKPLFVAPAKAGAQRLSSNYVSALDTWKSLGSCLRRNDESGMRQ